MITSNQVAKFTMPLQMAILDYRGQFYLTATDTVVDNIRISTNKGWALGGIRFINEIDGAVNRRAKSLGYGGDRKSKIFRDEVKNQIPAPAGVNSRMSFSY
ncbi:MAG: hypothetical protein ACI9BO_000475 [Zhongshania sp.]